MMECQFPTCGCDKYAICVLDPEVLKQLLKAQLLDFDTHTNT